jgi:SAM-dependent methyltransferase
MVEYDDSFYGYTTSHARQAAGVVCPLLIADLRPASVVDIGCGRGAWLAEWRRLGVEIRGLDFSAASSEELCIPKASFEAVDLVKGFAIEQRFDLAQCLEVAEHLPANCARGLVASLAKTSDIILFSAAPPGQGGENHVNEQPYEYWRDLWREQGFEMFDPIRSRIIGNRGIAPWYRFNIFIFANRSGISRLPAHYLNCVVDHANKVPDLAPLSYCFRRAVVRHIPVAVQTWLAKRLARGIGARHPKDEFSVSGSAR